MTSSRIGRPTRAAALAALVSAVALTAVGALAVGLQLRQDLSPAGERVNAIAAELAASRAAGTRPTALRAPSRVAARVVGEGGQVLASTGPQALFGRGGAPWWQRLATTAVGWRVLDGAVAAERVLPTGERVVVRAALPPGAGSMSGAAWGLLGGAVLLLAIVIGAVTGWWRSRLGARTRRLAQAADGLASGRGADVPDAGPPEWRSLAAGLRGVAERTAQLQEAAEAGFDGLAGAMRALAQPAAVRTPSGRMRNGALERLIGELAAADASALDSAVREGLDATGLVARRLSLADERVLDVESSALPGGRIVTVVERSEQERMAAFRRQVTGAAARHLQAPVAEIRAAGGELYAHVPAPSAPAVQRVLAAADRMDRLIGAILRGTPNDPRARALELRPLGVAGVLWTLAQSWDRDLRTRALRVELAIDEDLPIVRTDAALVSEILTEMIDNAARFTPRGGTITLSARGSAGGGVALDVGDTGAGLSAGEALHATERFFRGERAAALPGAGLGLGVAAALAERLGGRVVVEPGPGGRARLELPAALAPRPLNGIAA
jgi:signal transduction histidine kinase